MVTGNNTTFNVSKNNVQPLTSILLPINKVLNKGVKTMAAMVDIAVMVTDNGRFAFARYVTTFDAVPPGQQDTIIIPTAK